MQAVRESKKKPNLSPKHHTQHDVYIVLPHVIFQFLQLLLCLIEVTLPH